MIAPLFTNRLKKFQMHPEDGPHISLIICPLRSLIMDQVIKARSRGMKAVGILRKDEMEQDDIKGLQIKFTK